MRLATRLVLAFGFLATVSTAGLGVVVREDRRSAATTRFEKDVELACRNVRQELERQGESDRKLVAGACQSGELGDRVAIAIEKGDDLQGMILGYKKTVVDERNAFGFDELMLATTRGDVIGADPHALFAASPESVRRELTSDASTFSMRTGDHPALVVRCIRPVSGDRSVGFVGARYVAPLLERIGRATDARVAIGRVEGESESVQQAGCAFADARGTTLPIVVTKDKRSLLLELTRIDQTILYASLFSIVIALMLAVFLARNLGRPIAELASEARKVARGEARPLRVRGSGEIAELTLAFDRMIEDLAVTRRRLAATTRVAAWREVARRVAHEVKNPLAPIRAAVETLRRLRARDDPAFDGYFDEATRTVLDEVHRISNIVTEFTRFARLPAPHPVDVDLTDLVRITMKHHEASARGAKLRVVVKHEVPKIRADRDQLVQVLTNLVQNAIDAVEGIPNAEVIATLDHDDSHAWVTVRDNGKGIAQEISERLFEPYATTKASGTGLGLAIAQRIAIEHDGELAHVPTEDGKGAAFRLSLPKGGPPPLSDRKPSVNQE